MILTRWRGLPVPQAAQELPERPAVTHEDLAAAYRALVATDEAQAALVAYQYWLRRARPDAQRRRHP